MAEVEQALAGEVSEILALQSTLEEREAELMQNEQFRNFLDFQKTAKEQIESFWKRVEEEMIDKDIKSIKGEWGSLTIAERIGWNVDFENLPSKFFKKVPDTKRLTDTFRLEGKPPKGAEPTYTKYLTKRFK